MTFLAGEDSINITLHGGGLVAVVIIAIALAVAAILILAGNG